MYEGCAPREILVLIWSVAGWLKMFLMLRRVCAPAAFASESKSEMVEREHYVTRNQPKKSHMLLELDKML
jgi:hypothetical protein